MYTVLEESYRKNLHILLEKENKISWGYFNSKILVPLQ